MQVSEEDLAGLEAPALGRLRLFHFDNHLGALENLLGRGDDGGAGFRVLVVVDADAGAEFFSTMTWWPRWTASCTLEGTIPARNSLFLISLGTPISMVASEFSECLASKNPE